MSPTRPPDRGRSATLALSAWPLRRKVALALAVPLLLAGTLGGLRVQGDLTEAANSSSSARQVTVLGPAVEYLTAAEQAMVAAASADEDGPGALERALDAVRGAGDDLLAAKASADLTADQQYQVDAVLDLSQALRADDAGALSPDTLVAQLRQLQSGVTQLITGIVEEQITPEPRLELLSQALAGRFSLAMQQALVATERTGEAGSLELFSEFGAEGAAIERLASALGASEESVASLRTANAQRFRTVRTGGADLGGPEAYADYDRIITNLQNAVDEQLEAAAARARTDALINVAVTLAALVAAILLALLVSRLLLNPIRRVREGALAVAHERLPEAVARIRAGEEPGDITPIDVTTQEEIGQLARAVDDMHRQAVVLASGEAGLRAQVSQMFVTLSRRSTSLINQQLALIERLERDEEDPKRLESLFRLDHLAARMRRTSDSLLVLADAPTAHVVTDELTVSDAMHAATSAVQDYQRVRIRSANTLPIDRSAATDVVHLLTELVDNALTYSPPASVVTLRAEAVDTGVAVEVADAGLGIAAEEMETINAQLGSGGEVTPDTARRMGLFVVSRLSQRHGLVTSLRGNEEGGTTATVLLPSAVLSGGASVRDGRLTTSRTPGMTRPEEATPLTEAPPPPVRDVGSLIHASLGLPIPASAIAAPESGAPTPVTPATASAALAKLRPLRHDSGAAGPEAPEPSGTAGQPMLRPVADPAPAPADRADESAGPAGLPTRANGVAATPVGPSAPVRVAEPPEAAERSATVETAPPEHPAAPVTVGDLGESPAAAAPAGPVLAPEPPPFAASDDALGGDWTDPGDDGSETPIFKSLRSAWLSAGDDAQPWRRTEIEQGWDMADQVAETAAVVEVSESGLPVRRPGSRLVPGGVTPAPSAKVRDPEAIRARLAAHASGVSRGRAAATAADPSSMEAGS